MKKVLHIVLLVSLLFGFATTTVAQTTPNCDANGDGVCDILDILFYLNKAQAVANDIQATAQAPVATATPAVATVTAVPSQTPTTIPATNTPVAPTATSVPATAIPSQTPSVATVTPQPTATMAGMAMGLCGESMEVWHAPVLANGCQTKHEHGDAPPAWVMNSGKLPSFMGTHNTSAIENSTKHNFMKGYLLQDSTKSCIKIYVIQHGSSMGMERIAQFHSTQFWIQDCGGGVSYGSMWSDFGEAKLYPQGQRVMPENFDAIHQELANEGIIRVPTASNGCEQWYSEVRGNKPDMSVLFCGAVELYNINENTNPNGEYDSVNWDLTGNSGNFRQLDFAFPQERIVAGTYTTDQFGNIVNNCTGTSVYDGTTFGRICQNWKITPRLISDVASDTAEFGIRRVFGIRRNENYPDTGVVAPN